MQSNNEFIRHEPTEQTSALPEEITPYVTAEKLAENLQHYPEMAVEFNEQDRERIGRIKDVLMQIPLIHASSHAEVASGVYDILPFDQLPEGHRGHSHELDRSLGLTKYVFLHQGLAEKGIGRTIIQVSPQLLNGDNVVVTPYDIGMLTFVDEGTYTDLDEEHQDRVQKNYFDLMVIGRDWQEIVARRILANGIAGNSFFTLKTSETLGEIKHLGPVSSDHIIGSFPAGDFREHYRFLYEHGFSFENMEMARRETERTGKTFFVDPTPEQCGVDYAEASRFWKKLLDL